MENPVVQVRPLATFDRVAAIVIVLAVVFGLGVFAGREWLKYEIRSALFDGGLRR